MGKIRNGKELLTPARIFTAIGLACVALLGILFATALVRCFGPG